MRTGSEPKQGGDAGEGQIVVDRVTRFVGQGEELSIGFKTLSHWEFVGELVLAFDRFPAGRLARDGRSYTGFGDVVANAVLLPLGIAGAQALFAQGFLLVRGNLIVGDGNALPTTVILTVQAHYRMGCGA